MSKETKLTKEWSAYDPKEGYEKEMQDVKLKNGEVITMCWPNAGLWRVCEKQANPKYNNAHVAVAETLEVRLTHSRLR